MDWFFFPWSACMPRLRDSLRVANPGSIALPAIDFPLPGFAWLKLNDVVSAIPISSSPAKYAFGFTDRQVYRDYTTQPGSLAQYLGASAGSIGNDTRTFNLPWFGGGTTKKPYEVTAHDGLDQMTFFAYNFCYYHFYANAQLGLCPFLSTKSDSMLQPEISYLQLSTIQTALDRLIVGNAPGAFALSITSTIRGRNAGFFLAPLYGVPQNRFVSVSNYAARTVSVAIESNRLDLDALVTSFALRRYAAINALTAGSFLDWIANEYGITPQRSNLVPTFLGRDELYIDFSAVVATSSEGLGDLAGRGVGLTDRPKTRRLFTTEYGTLIGICSLVPTVRFTAAADFRHEQSTLAGLPSPSLEKMPYRSASLCELYNTGFIVNPFDDIDAQLIAYPAEVLDSDTGNPPTMSTYIDLDFKKNGYGYVPAYNSFFGDFDRAYGDISGSLSYWGFNHNMLPSAFDINAIALKNLKYSDISEIAGLMAARACYAHPDMVNPIFADTSLGSQNFILNANFDVEYSLPVKKQTLPSL